MKFKKYTDELNATSIMENWKLDCPDCGIWLEMPLLPQPVTGQKVYAYCDLCQHNVQLGRITALIVDMELEVEIEVINE